MEFNGILDLLNMLGAFIRKVFVDPKTSMNHEFRTRDNTLLGFGTICGILALCIFFLAC
jgi:hypothetical protein